LSILRPLRRLTTLLSTLTLTLTAGLVFAVAPAASAADSVTNLGLTSSTSSSEVEIVTGGGRLFVSARDRIVVTDTDGALIGYITDLSYVVGLTVTPDGTRVYAALRDSNEVIEIDASSLAITRRFDFAAYPCPYRLSLSGSVLWTGHGCGSGNGGVASFDLSAPAPQPVTALTGLASAPLLAAAGNTLVLGYSRVSPSKLMSYDVSTGSPQLRGEVDGLPYLSDLSITPDGSTALAAFPTRLEGWDTSSLTMIRQYGENASAQGSAVAVAVTPDGTKVVGGWTVRGVEVYDVTTGVTTYAKKSPTGWPNPMVDTGAITTAGDEVFSVLRTKGSTVLRLWRLEDATLSP
jgi:DNA-binding beta-propeller fold protein YncE